MSVVRTLIATAAVAFLAIPSLAIEAPLPMDEAFKIEAERDRAGISITWDIAPGYYLYRDHISALDGQDKALALETPSGVTKDDPSFGPKQVYYDGLTITVPSNPTKITLSYQGCQEDGVCYPATTKTVDTSTLTISEPTPLGAGTSASNADWSLSKSEPENVSNAPGFAVDTSQVETPVDRLISRGGVPLMLLGFAGFGLLLAFTPCVFPVYPIVTAMLSREREQLTARRGFMLSSSYVLGLAAAFGLLGMAAAWSGRNLQLALQSPFATGAIAVLFLVLAGSSFGLYELQLPAAVRDRFARRGWSGGSIPSASILGFSSAFLVGPCVTAPLAGALLYIARSGDVLVGAGALFALGLGKGIPLIVMATFGSGVLPRAGAWMETARRTFGLLFLATALYLATPLLSADTVLLLWALLCLALASYASLTEWNGGQARILRRLTAIASLLWGGLLLVGFATGGTDPLKPLAQLRSVGQTQITRTVHNASFDRIASTAELQEVLDRSPDREPTLLYVTADWCVTCRGIERDIFPDIQVRAELENVRLAMLDLSELDEPRQELMKALSVVGPPTIMFFGEGRKEARGTRLVGEFSVPELVEATRVAKAGAR